MKQFYRLLANTLIANVTTSFLWFAVTFWVYLETRNVMATAILGGSFMLAMAITGVFFGTLVDRYRKKQVIRAASMITAAAYITSGAIYVLVPHDQLLTIGGGWLWLFTIVILAGCIVENIRNIALSTCVTIMVPKEKRANANGMVGMVQGIAFMITSVFSGLAIGYLGMGWTLVIAIALTLLTLLDLLFVHIDEKGIVRDPTLTKAIDFQGAWRAVRLVPGLLALILFTTFNNLVGGVFMSLLDPYGLTLMSVQMWGVVFAISSVGFIAGGAVIAKLGLGKKPLRMLLLANVAMAMVGMLFGIRESVWLLAGGMFTYMAIFPVIEAAEQTTLQRVIPVRQQGRVFGFAQSVEALASPISAYMIGPIAQYAIIPYMKSDEGRATWGWLLGVGEARGIALVFVGASLIMLTASLLAFRTRSYRVLSHTYAGADQ